MKILLIIFGVSINLTYVLSVILAIKAIYKDWNKSIEDHIVAYLMLLLYIASSILIWHIDTRIITFLIHK